MAIPLAVFVDAACPGNGTEFAKGGYRIHFAEDDPRNVCVTELPGPHTNNRAHLHSILAVLIICYNMLPQNVTCIQTCSEIVVRTCLLVLLFFLNCLKAFVCKYNLFEIHLLICLL